MFVTKYRASDAIWLLNEIQKAMAKFERTRYPHMALADLYSKFFHFFQGQEMSDTAFDLRYDEFVHLFEHYESNLGTDPMLVRYEMEEDKKTEPEIETLMNNEGSTEYHGYCKKAQERFLATVFLRASNKQAYGPLLIGLENDFAQGSKRFPATLTAARNIKLTFRKEYGTSAQSFKQQSHTTVEDKENITPVTLTQIGNQVIAPDVTLTQMEELNKSESESPDDDIGETPRSLFAYAFVSVDKNEKPITESVNCHVTLTQTAITGDTSSVSSSEVPSLMIDDDSSYSDESIDSNESIDSYIIPPLINREIEESSGDESSDDDQCRSESSDSKSDSESDDDESDSDDSSAIPHLITREIRSRGNLFEDSSDDDSSTCSTTTVSSSDSVDNDDDSIANDYPFESFVSSLETYVESQYDTPSEKYVEPDPDTNTYNQVDDLALNGAPGQIPKSWILLDNESSVSIFCSKEYLHGIFRVEEKDKLRLYGTGGYIDVYEKGYLQDFGAVWYSPHSVANILSFAEVEERFVVTYHQTTSSFQVHHPSGVSMTFARRPPGRHYYFDATAFLKDTSSNDKLVAVQSSSHVPIDLSPADRQLVERVDPIYRAFGCPDPKSMLYMLKNGKIVDSPITHDEFKQYMSLINQAHPDALAGHATRKRPMSVNPTLLQIPQAVLDKYTNVILYGDICFIPRNIFFCTLSKDIEFFSTQSLSNRKMSTIFPLLETVIHLYRLRGLNPEWFLTDMEFRPLEAQLLALGVRLNITSENEHVGRIERAIRTAKEDVRTLLNNLPFSKYPAQILREAFLYAVFMRNLIVRQRNTDGISPAGLVLGTETNAKICAVPFGTLCYIKNNPKPYNSVTEPRTVPAISLKPLGNIQVGYEFLQLHNWEKVTCYQWKI